MAPLRLLFVVQRYGPEVRGGAEQAARTLAERLAERGHHIEVLTTTARSYVDWSGDLPVGTEELQGVTVHRLPVHPKRDPDTFGRLHHRVTSAVPPVDHELQRAWLQSQGPSVPELEPWLEANAARFDVAVFFTYLYATTTDGLPVAARHTATALVPCAHDEPPLALPVFDRIAHLADSLLFLTPEEAELVLGRFRLTAPDKIVGLGTVLDPPVGDIQAFRESHGLERDPYLLYVGRIDPSKGTSWLVDEFVAYKAVRPSLLRLVMIGEAVVPPEPRRDVIVVTDADDAVRNAAMAGAVALVHPSPFESFGMVVTEAWALGTPLIAFAGNDVLRGHVERSSGGLLVTTGAELGAAGELLMKDAAARDALGQAGLRHVQAHHAWPAVLDRWEDALAQTANRCSSARAPRPAPPRPVEPQPKPNRRLFLYENVEKQPQVPLMHGTSPNRRLLLDENRPKEPLVAGRRSGVAAIDQPTREALPPMWLVRPLAFLLGLVAALSIVGVASAIAWAFEPAVVIPGTLVLGPPLGWVAARSLPRWKSPAWTHIAAALVVAAVGAITAHNVVNHGQHVVADRDPGVYITTAKHLVDEGNLLVDGVVGPFVDTDGVMLNGAGFSPERFDGTLEPQFPHLTAVLLATAGWVSELGIFVMTPLIGGLALLCLYAWSTTAVGPRWAIVPAVVTGVSMPFMVFARDAFSEPIAMVLIFGGLWVLDLADRSGRRTVWLLAGLLIGASTMARVDGYLYLAPALLAVTLHLASKRRRERRQLGWAMGLFAAGLVVTTAIGFWDTAWLTGSYYREGLRPRLPSMLAAAVAAAAIGALVAPWLWRRRPDDTGDAGAVTHRPDDPGRALRQVRRWGRTDGGGATLGGSVATRVLAPTLLLRAVVLVAAVGLTGFFAWGYWVRPDPEGIPEVAVEGLNVLSYLPLAQTMSMHWLAWYVSPFGLAVGLAGLLVLLIRLGWSHRPEPALLAGLGAIFMTLLLYLWTPSITPDQPWAMRRFVVVAIPGLGLGAAALAQAAWRAVVDDPTKKLNRLAPVARRLVGAALAVAVAGGTLAATAGITWPVRGVRAQVPMRDRIHDVCDHVQEDDALLVPIDGILSLMMSVPIGVWCDVPSAGGNTDLDPLDVAELAVEWEKEGRRLVVVSSSATPLMNTLLPSGIVEDTIATASVFPKAINPTITSRPRRVVVDGRLGKGPDGEVTFYLYPIDVDAARRYLESSPEAASAGT